jgi:HAD superfamily hydrolase (TIGR01509 family)
VDSGGHSKPPDPTIDAIVFDLDGVLIDSEPVWEAVRRAVVAEGGGWWMPDTQRRLMGMGTTEWARYLSEDLGVRLTPEEVARTVIDRMEAAYRQELPLLPGAVEAVRRIGGRWRLGLASSSPPEVIRLVLAQAGLGDAFAATASSDEVGSGKPAPDVYLLAARRLGVDPARCVAIEDSSNGVRSAAAAAFRVVAIPRPSYPPDPDALERASLVLGDLSGLTPEALERLARR